MNQTEFKGFYQSTSKSLWAYIYRICGDSIIAEDIVQESYLRFLQKPHDGLTEPQMKSYLYTIATRLNIDRWKRAKVHEKGLFSFNQNGHHSENLDDRINMKTDMAAVFSEMKPQERALLWLAFVEEQPHRTIAGILGLKEKSVRVALFRARKKVAKILNRKGLNAEVLS